MAAPYTAPSQDCDAFNCPHCHAFAQQEWGDATADRHRGSTLIGRWRVQECKFSRCGRCEKSAIWVDGRMTHPDVGSAPPPNSDIPDDIRYDYLEAVGIADRSPRGAAALLRLCVQKLCKHLGEPGENINADIARLVKKGLPAQVQQALDVVRVIGNNAVHPGEIDLTDDRKTAATLFELVNLIAQVMISEPKAVQEMYDKLPQSALDAISERDQANP